MQRISSSLSNSYNYNDTNTDINRYSSKSSLKSKNIKDLSYMFFGCFHLKNLLNISKWNTSNIIDLSLMFYDCKSLISLPDISK